METTAAPQQCTICHALSCCDISCCELPPHIFPSLQVPTPFTIVEYMLSKLVPLPLLNQDNFNHNQFWDKETWEEWVINRKETGTGGKGSFTQWVHCEYIVSSGEIRPHYIPSGSMLGIFQKNSSIWSDHTHQAHGGYIVITFKKYPASGHWVHCERNLIP